jgi:nitric oxide reductase large subunit
VHTAEYTFSVNEPHPADKSDVSASISIVIILLVVLLMLIWICLKKYRKLEGEARRMLDEFKNRNSKERFGL